VVLNRTENLDNVPFAVLVVGVQMIVVGEVQRTGAVEVLNRAENFDNFPFAVLAEVVVGVQMTAEEVQRSGAEVCNRTENLDNAPWRALLAEIVVGMTAVVEVQWAAVETLTKSLSIIVEMQRIGMVASVSVEVVGIVSKIVEVVEQDC